VLEVSHREQKKTVSSFTKYIEGSACEMMWKGVIAD